MALGRQWLHGAEIIPELKAVWRFALEAKRDDNLLSFNLKNW
jgi:hypothetical protein